MEKKKVNVLAIILFILLLCSLCYIGYDKLNTKEIKCKDTNQKETEVSENTYNKDGIFIKDLMSKIYVRTTTREENQLYIQDSTTIKDLNENYVNFLVITRMDRSSEIRAFSKEAFDETAFEMFGEKLNRSEKIVSLCGLTYKLFGDYYDRDGIGEGCGGARVRWFDKITNVTNDTDHIYIYQKIGFQCGENICKNVKKGTEAYNPYEGYDVVGEIDFVNKTEEQMVDEVIDQLHEYKFTFKLDKANNNYYFEKVERVS